VAGRNPGDIRKKRITFLRALRGETSMELLKQILSNSNLNEAYKKVYRNKGASGVDGITISELKEHLQNNKQKLLSEIRARKYKPEPVRRVEIPKANGGVRKLGIPTVVDRVIQQAINQVLTPIYEEQFSDSSYGFRPKRSAQGAVLKSLELINDGYDWVVDIDLERFFDTVHHDRLMNIISRTVIDGDVISLIRKFLVSGVMINNKYEDTIIGTPQGGNLSPLLSNIMLNELDNELETRGLHFVRYADDCIILVKSKKSAERVMTSITNFIEKKLGLKVNATKSKVDRPNNIKFLGYGYYLDFKEGKYHLKAHEKSIEKFIRKLKYLTKRSWSVSLDYRLLKIRQVIMGWVQYFKYAKMKIQLRNIDRKLRARIRVIIWKQWKVPKKRMKSLMKLGISLGEAKGITYCRKGFQFTGHSRVIQKAINNSRLKKRGLTSALDHYLKVQTVI
jgi:group II intron reverse transcriptase/maturase